MGLIRQIYKYFFGKTNQAIWEQFALEKNGNFTEGRYDNQDRVEISHGAYHIIFDSYIYFQTVGGHTRETEFTRVRLGFQSKDALLLKLTNQGIAARVGKLFGMQDIEVGNPPFAKRFLIKGNDVFKIQMIFSDDRIQELLLAQKDIQLEITATEGIFHEPVTEGNAMLYYLSDTPLKTIGQLYDLYDLFTTLADKLTKLGSAEPVK